MLATGTKATDLRRTVRLLSLDRLTLRKLSMGTFPLIILAGLIASFIACFHCVLSLRAGTVRRLERHAS
jgi:hypothetical protein